MDATTALVVVGVLVALAIVAAAGGFDRTRRARRTVVERPARTVVEERPVATERVERRIVD